MSEQLRSALIAECKRQRENCEYTAVSLHLWLADLRWWKGFFAIVPAVAGALAGLGTLQTGDELLQGIGVVGAVVAAAAPAIFSALRFDSRIEQIQRTAPEFLNLRDRFRQAAELTSQRSVEEFQRDFDHLSDRLEKARCEALTIPEKYFQQAQAKIKAGHFVHAVDDPQERV